MSAIFGDWLQSQMDERGWSRATLARKAKMTTGAISHIINETRGAGPEFCLAISDALRIPPEEIFRRAGLLPPESERDTATQEAAYLFAQLGAYDRQQVLEDMRRRMNQENYHVLKEAQEMYAVIGQEQTQESLDLIRKYLDELKQQGYKQVK